MRGFVWGWILTLAGPLVFKLRAFLPGANVWHALKAGTYVLALGLGVWGGIRATLWWRGDMLTVAEAKTQCGTTVAAITIAAQLKAVNARARLVLERELRISEDEALVADAISKMREIRDATVSQPGTSVQPGVFIGPDDGWLRDWRQRAGVGGGARRR